MRQVRGLLRSRPQVKTRYSTVMTHRPLYARLIMLAAVTAIATGCASTPATTTATVEPPQTLNTSAGPITSSRVMPARAATFAWKVIKGPHEGQTLEGGIESTGGSTFRLTVSDLRIVDMTHNDKGEWLLPRECDLGEKVEVLYDPPLLMLPHTLSTTEPTQPATVKMTVRHLDGGGERDKGECTYTVALLGTQRVTTPAGVFDAYIVRTVRRLNLGLAKGTVTVDTAYAVERGIVIERVTENLKAVGFITMKKESEFRLAK